MILPDSSDDLNGLHYKILNHPERIPNNRHVLSKSHNTTRLHWYARLSYTNSGPSSRKQHFISTIIEKPYKRTAAAKRWRLSPQRAKPGTSESSCHTARRKLMHTVNWICYRLLLKTERFLTLAVGGREKLGLNDSQLSNQSRGRVGRTGRLPRPSQPRYVPVNTDSTRRQAWRIL